MDAPPTNGEQHKNIPTDLTDHEGLPAYRSAVPANDENLHIKTTLARQTDPAALKKIIVQQAETIKRLEYELAHVKKRVDQSAHVQTAFMDTMSHELRTPLNGILGMTQLIMDMPLSGEARDHLKTIDESGQHLASIIDQILDYVHLTKNKVLLAHKAFQLEAALNEVISPFIRKIYDKDLELTLDYDLNQGEEVVADQKRVQQLITILLENAIKFTTEGHIAVYVTTRRPEQQNKPLDTVRELIIRVTDTGTGIDKDAQEIIFLPFRQVDGSMKRQHGGIGLGLSLGAEVVALMGGKIEVNSSKGIGTTFTITTPVKAVPSSQKHAYPPFGGAKLGIICNLAAQKKAIAHMIERWGLVPTIWPINDKKRTDGPIPEAAAWLVEYEPENTHLKKIVGNIISQTNQTRPFVIALIRPGITLSMNERALFGVVIEKPLRRRNLYEALVFGFNASVNTHDTFGGYNTLITPSSHLLLIEPNRINQKVLLRILENLAVDVDVVSELNQVADTWPESHYDAILVNPACDASEDMAKLRDFAWAVQKDGGPRLVALIPKEGRSADRLKAAGISHHLTMPVNLNALREAIGLTAQ